MGKARAGEPGLWDPQEVARQGTLLHQEQGREQAQQGLVPKAGPAKGHWILQVKQEGGKAFGSAPNQAKPGAPASWGASSPEHQPPPDTPAQAAGWEPLFSSFPFQGQPPAVCPAWEGAAASPCHPLLCFQQAQPQPDGKPKAFFHSGMLQRGWEELPGHGCSAWGRSAVQPLAHGTLETGWR